ncbi:hypothetical protein JCM10207_004556 [Rhodosporidiobolus poonsookiae]
MSAPLPLAGPSSPSAILSPKPSTSQTPPSTSPTTPIPHRRTPLSSAKSKRSPAANRAWNRRLSFSSSAPSASTSPLPSGTATPVFHFASQPLLGGLSLQLQRGGDEPMHNASSSGAFEFGEMAMSLYAAGAGNVTPRSLRRLSPKKKEGTPRQRQKRVKTGINDLPDELLLRIFSFLNDQQGFAPRPGIGPAPEWYTPPLRIALVCRRWLEPARQLFYRFVKISHLGRISHLYETFSTTKLSLAVRHLSIDLPASAVDKLAVPPPAASDRAAHEADSDSDVFNSGPPTPTEGSVVPRDGHSLAVLYALSKSPKADERKKGRRPYLPQDQLRAIFQACSQLLGLEIAGVPPALLFTPATFSSQKPLTISTQPPSPGSPSALHHLHLLRLSTVSNLTLKAPAPGSSDDVELDRLGSITVRDALLALTGLRQLTLKGYVSTSLVPLDFAPTRTFIGFAARPLPSRARARALLPLTRLSLQECAMSPPDLLALLRQIRPGSLRELIVDESFDPALARRRARESLWARPTVEGLSDDEVASLLKGSLTLLRATLHNYPVVSPTAPAITSSPPASPQARRRPLPSAQQRQRQAEEEKHVLDAFIAQCEHLAVLDLGGSVVSPDLFQPFVPSASHAPPAFPSREAPLPSFPSTVRVLTLRSPPSLPPSALLPFLTSLSHPLHPHALRILRVYGGTEHGWANPSACWDVQRACWAARGGGIKWVTGAQTGLGWGGSEWRFGGAGTSAGTGMGAGASTGASAAASTVASAAASTAARAPSNPPASPPTVPARPQRDLAPLPAPRSHVSASVAASNLAAAEAAITPPGMALTSGMAWATMAAQREGARAGGGW